MRQGKKAVRVAHITALVVVQTEEATKEGDGRRKGSGRDRAGCSGIAFSLNILLRSATFDWLFT